MTSGFLEVAKQHVDRLRLRDEASRTQKGLRINGRRICSKSLACRMPSTLSKSSSTAGRREWPDAMSAGSQTSRCSEKSTACTCERGTIRSPALISETAIAPSIMENTSSSITLRRRASPSTLSTSALSFNSSSWKTEVRRSRKVRPKVGLGGSEELDIFAETAVF